MPEMCKDRYEKNNVQLKVDLCPEDTLIECRPVALSQIIINLLNNSFDAVNSLKNSFVRVVLDIYETTIKITVMDSGPGIPEDIAKKIMEPFFTTKPIGKVTGIGLSISSGIAKDHKGRLTLVRDTSITQFELVIPKSQSLPEVFPASRSKAS